MQRSVKAPIKAKAAKPVKKTNKTNKMTQKRSKSTLSTTPLTKPLFQIAPLSNIMLSPFTQSQRFMAKGGKGDKGGKNDKKTTAANGPGAGEGFDSKPFLEKMENFVEAYTTELSNVKVGRATPEMLHDIVVESAGKKVPLKAISQIYVKPPASLIVSLHEPSDSLDKAVCNAISGAGMDLNPFAEAVHGVPSIIVPFPKPTKELRESLIKITKTKAEETKINIRNTRKLWNDAIKKAGLPKDDAFRGEQDCQKQTDKHCDAVSDLAAKKEKEINAV
jgi:ribosome recycling factor